MGGIEFIYAWPFGTDKVTRFLAAQIDRFLWKEKHGLECAVVHATISGLMVGYERCAEGGIRTHMRGNLNGF